MNFVAATSDVWMSSNYHVVTRLGILIDNVWKRGGWLYFDSKVYRQGAWTSGWFFTV